MCWFGVLGTILYFSRRIIKTIEPRESNKLTMSVRTQNVFSLWYNTEDCGFRCPTILNLRCCYGKFTSWIITIHTQETWGFSASSGPSPFSLVAPKKKTSFAGASYRSRHPCQGHSNRCKGPHQLFFLCLPQFGRQCQRVDLCSNRGRFSTCSHSFHLGLDLSYGAGTWPLTWYSVRTITVMVFATHNLGLPPPANAVVFAALIWWVIVPQTRSGCQANNWLSWNLAFDPLEYL